MNKEKKNLIWVVGAGTGGHIIPALSLQEEMAKVNPQLKFIFWGTRDRLEAKLIPQAGKKLIMIDAKAWKGKGLLNKFDMLLSLIVSFFQVLKVGLKNKPIAMISVGGYVSVPVAFVARLLGAKVFIIEPNIRAGMANKLISKFSTKAYSCLGSDAASSFKCPVSETGSPIPSHFRETKIRTKVLHILILGGSQGARILCEKGLTHFKELLKWDSSVHLTLQSGENNLEFSQKLQADLKIENTSTIIPFIHNMNETLSVTDLVIARAGAMTIAELSTAGLPTILVPYPFAADDHQRKNAQYLEKQNAVVSLDEKDPDFDRKLSAHLRSLTVDKNSFDRRLALSKNFKRMARPQAAKIIAQDILDKI